MPIPLLLGIPRHKRKKMLYHILLLHQSYVLPSLHENKFDSPPHSTSNQLEYHKDNRPHLIFKEHLLADFLTPLYTLFVLTVV